MKVALTGSHGLIGSALADRLAGAGHQVVKLVRGPAGPGEVQWDPSRGSIDAAALEGVDAAVHLAGAGVGDHRWTAAYKAKVLASRVDGTTLLAKTLATLSPTPRTLLSGSAVGFYGDRGDVELTESSPPGRGFLADLCIQWEEATGAAESAGIRVVHLRTGIVMSGQGGALKKQLPLFKFGLGGRLGSGRQYLSWIALADELAAIEHCLTTPTIRGPVNLTAPGPVTNASFTAALGRAVHRPALLAVPAFALRLALGREFADEALLGGQRVLPGLLGASGYTFRLPRLDDALRASIA